MKNERKILRNAKHIFWSAGITVCMYNISTTIGFKDFTFISELHFQRWVTSAPGGSNIGNHGRYNIKIISIVRTWGI